MSSSAATSKASPSQAAQDERFDIQKKTFGKWLNSQLNSVSEDQATKKKIGRVTDLFFDLRDGHILLEVLEILTKKKVKRERGSLRVHKLSNVAIVLKVLRENQVKLVNINNVEIVDGNPKITLALVWSIILHWQFNKVLGSEIQHVSNLEKSLLAWCRQSTQDYAKHGVNVLDFTHSWQDGLAFCALLHHFCPQLFDFERKVLRECRDAPARLELAFDLFHQHMGLAKLLDAEDLHNTKPDKKSVMTYLMCIFQKVSSQDEDIDMNTLANVSLESDPGFKPANLISSPLKTPMKNGKPMDYKTFCNVHEDVLEWLLTNEDRLKAMEAVGSDFESVRSQFRQMQAFAHEVLAQDFPEQEVRKEGQRLMESGLPAKEKKDVQVRVKLLQDRWTQFRAQAAERQEKVTKTLMTLQKAEIDNIRQWMTLTEDKISRMTTIGTSIAEVKENLEEHLELDSEFKKREALISNFISVQPPEGKDSYLGFEEHDLEGYLMAIEERWFVLCSWIENRSDVLNQVLKVWSQFEDDKKSLISWLDVVERGLKKMEQSPTEEKRQLLGQAQQITDIQADLQARQRQLESLDSLAENLIKLLETSDKTVAMDIAKTMEQLQDRWEILSEVMDAQRLRLTSLGLNIASPVEATSSSSSGRTAEKHRRAQVEEDASLKKRKITGSKRINFETSYVQALSWLQSTGESLQRRIADPELLLQPSSKDDDELGQEVNANLAGLCQETLSLGEDLMSEIESANDFPPDYLANVAEKVTSLRSRIQQVESARQLLCDKQDYAKCKAKFYSKLKQVNDQLVNYQSWLDEVGTKTGDSLDAVENALKLCSQKLSALRSIKECDLEELKRVSGEVALHPIALDDPANNVKSDFYSCCDIWEALEGQCSQREEVLISLRKDLSGLDTVTNETDIAVFSSYASPKYQDDTCDLDLVSKLQKPIWIESVDDMESEIDELQTRLHSGDMRDELKRQVECRISQLNAKLKQLKQFLAELEGLDDWIREAERTLATPLASQDNVDDLERQLRDSNALLDDIFRFKPNITVLNDAGPRLRNDATTEFTETVLAPKLKEINQKWQTTVDEANRQNRAIRQRIEDGKSVSSDVSELQAFAKAVEQELKPLLNDPVTQPADLSQRASQLSDLLAKMEKKQPSFDRVARRAEEGRVDKNSWASLSGQWSNLAKTVAERQGSLKQASVEYGEFMTEFAQEQVWLEKMGRKLKKSALTAADAEEISEEHDEIENFLNNHDEERVARLEDLARSLTAKNIVISPFVQDVNQLKSRWTELAQKGKKRLALLEGSIEEAQEWEYKLIEVQEWLVEKDILLSSHLEQELTVDDLPEESQKMLREFEDQENILSEMDEQVDAYRDSGKQEAAARLEDQLLLIHKKFQELLMKFELFQQPPTVEYEPRLDRIHRQLRDIGQNVILTDLRSANPEDIRDQLHHAKCIYNALSDIKPEVENVIKMGRKVVDTKAVDNVADLTVKIDELKEDFNDIGAKITEARKVLEKALELSEPMEKHVESVLTWLNSTDSQMASLKGTSAEVKAFIKLKHKEMMALKDQVRLIRSAQEELYLLRDASQLPQLKETTRVLESKWAKVLSKLEKRHDQLVKGKPQWAKKEIDVVDFNQLKLSPVKEKPPIREATPPLISEFRNKLRNASIWLGDIEGKMASDRDSEQQALGQEVEQWRPKISELKKLSEKIVSSLANRRQDVEPGMKELDRRWDSIIKQVEQKLKAKEKFKVVEVENIKTTITDISVPETTVMSPSDEDTIHTLPEDTTAVKRPVASDLDLDWKRRKSDDAAGRGERESSLLSSGDSSPDLEMVTGTIILQSNSPTFMRETVSKIPRSKVPSQDHSLVKTPPKTLPKPKWFSLDASNSPTEQSNQNVSHKTKSNGNNNNIKEDDDMKLETYEDFDAFMAKENSAIDRILNEANMELAEVQRRAKYVPKSKANNEHHMRDIKKYEIECTEMLAKIQKANQKLNQLESEQNLRLKRDFISIEVKAIEADAATLISRGDTLVLLSHRDDMQKGEQVHQRVEKLRKTWQALKSRADVMMNEASKTETEMKQFRQDMANLKQWLEESNRQLLRKPKDAELVSLATEIVKKKEEIDKLSRQSMAWPKTDFMDTQNIQLTMVLTQWETLQQKVIQLGKDKLSQTPKKEPFNIEPAGNKHAPEILSRIEKMREAVAAIEKQLKTEVLSNKIFEHLEEQEKALNTVSEALEKLRPTIKRAAKDLEGMTGALSVEYLEKIVALSEKLRDEWSLVNQHFSERQAVWTECHDKLQNFKQKRMELENWMERAEHLLIGQQPNKNLPAMSSPDQIQIERQVPEKNKEVTDFALLGKEIMNLSSIQERMETQAQVDRLLKRFKFLLSQVLSQREIMNKEKFHNNVNYMNKWISDSLKRISAPVNMSEIEALKEAIEMLDSFDEPLVEKEKQMSKLTNSNAAISSDITLKLKTKYELLIKTLAERKDELKKRIQGLNGLTSKIVTALVWVEHIQTEITDAKSKHDTKTLSNLRRSIKEKQPELDDATAQFSVLQDELSRLELTVNQELESKVNQLRVKLEELYASAEVSGRPAVSSSSSSSPKEVKKPPRSVKSSVSPPSKTPKTPPSAHRTPQIFASLRDHRDWVRRKKLQLASLNLAGTVSSVQKQAEDSITFRQQLEDQRSPIVEDIHLGQELGNEEVDECLNQLEHEWGELCDLAEVWQNQVDNTLANLRIFEKSLNMIETKLGHAEEANHMWLEMAAKRMQGQGDEQEHLQRLIIQVDSLELNMAELRGQAQRIPSLSPATRITLDKLEKRMQNLKRELEQQQRRRLSPSEARQFDEFNSVLPQGWERGLSGPENVPYYLNHKNETTQWDHPVFDELINSVMEMNSVKYSAYRLALKLRKVQQKLCLDLLDLEVAISGFNGHGLTPQRHDLEIQVPEMTLVLTSIYEALHQEEPEEVNVPLCVDLALNWLLNVYDPNRLGRMRVLSFKIGVLTLCKSPLTEKYLHMFKLVASKDKRLTQEQLAALLSDCIMLPKVMGEVSAFGGPNVEPSVESCFGLGLKEGQVRPKQIDAKQFLKWLKQEPQSMVWLPVLHRLASAETAKHNVKCKVCKMSPIVGFRYHCLKCFNFDLCHNCFFVGKVAKGHKFEHPMQEYCTSTGTSVNLKNFGQSVRNSFRSKNYFKNKQKKLGYLPVTSHNPDSETMSSSTMSPNLSMGSRDLGGSNMDSLQPRLVNPGDSNMTTLSDPLRTEDEHERIARFCRELEDLEQVELEPISVDLKDENLHSTLKRLEEENKKLMKEYLRLKDQRANELKNESFEEEALHKELKESSHLESRMAILENHNEQLLMQLKRLRTLVVAEDNRNFGTLQSKAVIPSELRSEEPGVNGSSLVRRLPPNSEEFRRASANMDNLKVMNLHQDDDSLNLSDHETQRVSD